MHTEECLYLNIVCILSHEGMCFVREGGVREDPSSLIF